MRVRSWWPQRRPSLATVLVLAFVVDGLLLRLIDLGARAMHHDESLHATYAWYFMEGRGYFHDPLMHGPLQFHLIAALFKLFGDGETMSRLPAALLGTALIASPLLLRRWLGGAGTAIAAFCFALSPTLLYYSRFARNDLPVALFTVLLVAAIWRYRAEGRLRWLLLLAGATALSFASKETIYLFEAVLLVYLDVVLWRALIAQRRAAHGTTRGRLLVEAALLPTAWVVAALWPLLGRVRARLGLHTLPREGELLIVLGALTVTQLGALTALPLPRAGITLEGDALLLYGSVATLLLIAGACAVGLAWDWRRFALAAGLFALITIPLYSTFFTNPEGIVTGFWGSLDYWLAQQDVRRGEQPGFYYLMMLPLYELWVLIPALAGGVWLLWRRDGLAALLAWWFAGSFVALSLAGEKMPWLNVHLVTPLALLAGLALGRALPALRDALVDERVRVRAWLGALVLAVPAVAIVALTLRTATALSFAHPDTPVEPMIYTQTAPDVPVLSRRIVALLEAPDGATEVVVDTTASLSWPWAWYLRGRTVRYLDAEAIRSEPPSGRAIVIVAGDTLSASDPMRARFAPAIPYRHRWWFPEQGYKSARFGSVARGIADGSLPRAWWHFVLHRIDRSAIGSLDGEVLFPRAAPGAAAGDRPADAGD
ncbi:MAG: TIGR03663 family protein [Chloroflexi bacterium]|nr:TIGR03663 family protein [Chloroflexota bacterium]